MNIEVECEEGATRLLGMVSSPEEVLAAEEVAAIVAGVKSVDNLLKSTLHAVSRYRREG
jgi:osmotically-inducible protein OsmY